jgi:hypothetical protein
MLRVDPGRFDKPFENLRVLSPVEGSNLNPCSFLCFPLLDRPLFFFYTPTIFSNRNILVTFKSVYMGLHKKDLMQGDVPRTGLGPFLE